MFRPTLNRIRALEKVKIPDSQAEIGVYNLLRNHGSVVLHGSPVSSFEAGFVIMRSSRKAGLGILGMLGVICTLAIPSVGLSPTLFLSSFDLSSQDIVAERGDWVESSGPQGISLVPTGDGGNALEFDNTQLQGVNLFLGGLFASGARPDEGRLRATLRMRILNSHSPFSFGFLIDTPTSDFVPVTGPGDDGNLWVARQNTGTSLPVDTELLFLIEIWRQSRFDDWEYAVTVQYQLPSGEGGGDKTIVIAPSVKNGTIGIVYGSQCVPVIGLRLDKPAGVPGAVLTDAIRIVHNY